MYLQPRQVEIERTERVLSHLHEDDLKAIMVALDLDLEGRLGLAKQLCIFSHILRQRPNLMEASESV